MIIDEKTVKSRLEDILSENNIAGMAVAVTNKKETVFASGFGVESVERPVLKVETSSLFKIASITKMVTGITVMRLVEKGLLDLDVPVKKYVPWLTLSRPEAVEKMTLRHLLSHSSGLSGKIFYNCPKDERYLEQTLKEILPKLEMNTLPGDGAFLYSNYGFVLSSYIAQSVTGKTYSELATETVLKPLGMDRTFYDFNVVSTYNVALPHVEDENGKLKVKHFLASEATRFGSGELFSNAIDLCKLMRFFLNAGVADSGERILSSESVRTMMSRQVKRDENDYHGFAVHIRLFGGRYIYGHTGWMPPYRASLFFDPDKDVGVIVLLNTDRDAIRNDILSMFL